MALGHPSTILTDHVHPTKANSSEDALSLIKHISLASRIIFVSGGRCSGKTSMCMELRDEMLPTVTVLQEIDTSSSSDATVQLASGIRNAHEILSGKVLVVFGVPEVADSFSALGIHPRWAFYIAGPHGVPAEDEIKAGEEQARQRGFAVLPYDTLYGELIQAIRHVVDGSNFN